jgi:hypothetical protein
MTEEEIQDAYDEMLAYENKLFKEYQTALRNSKALDADIDKEIERMNNIIGTPKQPKQANLFKD